MRVYINYTIEQEYFSKSAIKLMNFVSTAFKDQLPAEISNVFRQKNKKLIKYYNILTTNTRMIVLFVSILSGFLYLYFLFEITVLNALLVYVVYKHEKNSEAILDTAKTIYSGEAYV